MFRSRVLVIGGFSLHWGIWDSLSTLSYLQWDMLNIFLSIFRSNANSLQDVMGTTQPVCFGY
jgi:hypothetical protein